MLKLPHLAVRENTMIDLSTLNVQEFIANCFVSQRPIVNGDTITLKNAIVVKHICITLPKDSMDLFNKIFSRIIIYVKDNVIRFWSGYGEKVKKADGSFVYKLGLPKYTVKVLA